MKNFQIIALKKFQNTSNYRCVENGIYNDLNDQNGFSTYRIAITVTLENEQMLTDTIEKQLESHFIYIEEALGLLTNNTYTYILGGELEDIQQFLVLQNKRS